MRSVPADSRPGASPIGWATGGGAAQILFSIFGELVFDRGPAGIGTIWGCAGIGLSAGGGLAYRLGSASPSKAISAAIVICYIVHGGSYVVFSQMRSFTLGPGLHRSLAGGRGSQHRPEHVQLLRIVDDRFRGRVFSTMESTQWSVMMLSMVAAGMASQYRGSPDHRGHRRHPQLHHRDILGLGPLHRPIARARPDIAPDEIAWRASVDRASGSSHAARRVQHHLCRASQSCSLPAPPNASAAASPCAWPRRRPCRHPLSPFGSRSPRPPQECGAAPLPRQPRTRGRNRAHVREVEERSAASTAWSTMPPALPASIRSKSPKTTGTSSTT